MGYGLVVVLCLSQKKKGSIEPFFLTDSLFLSEFIPIRQIFESAALSGLSTARSRV